MEHRLYNVIVEGSSGQPTIEESPTKDDELGRNNILRFMDLMEDMWLLMIELVK